MLITSVNLSRYRIIRYLLYYIYVQYIVVTQFHNKHG